MAIRGINFFSGRNVISEEVSYGRIVIKVASEHMSRLIFFLLRLRKTHLTEFLNGLCYTSYSGSNSYLYSLSRHAATLITYAAAKKYDESRRVGPTDLHKICWSSIWTSEKRSASPQYDLKSDTRFQYEMQAR